MNIRFDDLESVSCGVCGSHTATHACVRDGFTIVRCTECGLYYVTPRLKPKVLEAMYNSDEISPHSYYAETKDADRQTFRKRLAIIEQVLGRKGKILDIGCNIGTLLFLAKERGWLCEGMDINARVRRSFHNSGIHITIGNVLAASYPKESFDVIVMNDLIEHVPQPKKLLMKVRSWLKDDGVLFLVTPDGGSAMFSFLGRRWFHLKPNEHLHYFTRSSLERLFHDTGYRIVYLRHLGRHRSLKTLAIKSASLFGPLSQIMTSVIRFLRLQSVSVPFNLLDEYAVIVRKNGSSAGFSASKQRL